MRKLSGSAEKLLAFLYGLEKGRDYELPKVISKVTGISQSELSQLAKVLEERQLLKRTKAGSFSEYRLTEAGRLYAKERHETLKPNPQTQFDILKPIAVNSTAKVKAAHKLPIIVPFLNPMQPAELEELTADYLVNKKPLKNQTILVLKVRGRTIELTASSMVVYATPRYVAQEATMQALHDALVEECLSALSELESELNAKNGYFKLKRRHKVVGEGLELDYHIGDEHLAFVNDEIAKGSDEAGEVVKLKHPGTDKVCTVVEHSKHTAGGTGIKEMEFKGATFALPHARRWEDLIDAYEHKGWDPLYEREARIEDKKILHDVEIKLKGVADNEFTHIPLIQETKDMMGKMNKVLGILLAGKQPTKRLQTELLVYNESQRRL